MKKGRGIKGNTLDPKFIYLIIFKIYLIKRNLYC